MKFCVSSRQEPNILKQTDEIKVQQRDYRQIYDLLDDYPDKTIILNYIDITNKKIQKDLKELAVLSKNKLVLSVFHLTNLDFIKSELNLPFYLAHPVSTLEQLQTVKQLGVNQALINGVICHQLHKAKIINIPLRLIPNIAHLDGLPRENGVAGNWMRPQDIDEYSLYINTIEFGTQPLNRERVLLRLYKKEKAWYGDLGHIVQDLNYVGNCANISKQPILTRMNCGQKCATNDCRLCYNLLELSTNRTFQDTFGHHKISNLKGEYKDEL